VKRYIAIIFTSLLLLIISACGGEETSSSDSSKKQAGDITIGTWGGDYEKFLKDFVNPGFSETNPDTNVILAPGSTDSRLTKMRAEKEGVGTYDLMHLQDNMVQQMINEDILMEIDFSKIPNAKNINPNLQNPYFVPHIYSAAVIVYNENQVKEKPDSWEILWDPKYKGKIGIYTPTYERWLYAAASLEGVADNNNWDEAWDRLFELKSLEPKFYTSQEQLGTALQTGEVYLSITWKSRAKMWNDAGGEPLGSVIPKEGTYPTLFGGTIPKNAKNIDAAYDYLNAMLDPKAQADFAVNMGYSPVVSNAELSEKDSEIFGFSEEEENLIKPADLKYIADNFARWKNKFDIEFVGQ
jgi:putative spermidine/putrescine transport system substrate-binding protein